MWGSCGGGWGIGKLNKNEWAIYRPRVWLAVGNLNFQSVELPISQIPTPFPLSPFWGGGGGGGGSAKY